MGTLIAFGIIIIGIVVLFPAVDRKLEQINIRQNLGELEEEKE